ncbi:hypothetical protein L596_029504 [Steinernema carpocapsae]|nr:hypothetical protein L596_029504 [Steinernema carpocapsae]
MVGEPKNRRVTSRLPKLSDNPEGGPQKVYGVIFTCTVTRMVHLELVGDMTTINFLRALRRFISEKDKPDDITCDKDHKCCWRKSYSRCTSKRALKTRKS